MQNRYAALALAGALAFSASHHGGGAERAAPGAPAAAPAAPRPGLTILEFKPAMDDLMTMLVQPRHIKLYSPDRRRTGGWRGSN